MPKDARHVAVCGIYSYSHNMCSMVVCNVCFLAEGGKKIMGYIKATMMLSKVVAILNKMPRSGGSSKKNVFISSDIQQNFTMVYFSLI